MNTVARSNPVQGIVLYPHIILRERERESVCVCVCVCVGSRHCHGPTPHLKAPSTYPTESMKCEHLHHQERSSKLKVDAMSVMFMLHSKIRG
jgi:hypothetical protein